MLTLDKSRHPFWTPTERAGLKAMGKFYQTWTGRDPIKDSIVGGMIWAYVKATRKKKENL